MEHPALERKVMGLNFKNPLGIAAGFDKNGEMSDGLSAFGFGFVEIGTVTPLPQPGNPKPRLFRLKKDKALINRMGFNNAGAEVITGRLNSRKSSIIIGGNIGKNKVTPNDLAVNDYVKCMEALYDQVDYFVVNVSSPNTPGLRELQEKEPLGKILRAVQEENARRKGKPLLVKIAPDLNETQLKDIAEIVMKIPLTGIIASNTTLSREGLLSGQATIKNAGNGGLSGKPLQSRARNIVHFLRNMLGHDFVIIGVGGIMGPEDAGEMLKAGADLIQVYTGFIYQGPSLARKINRFLINYHAN